MGSSTDAMWAIAPALLTSHTGYELMSMLSQQYSNPSRAEFLAVQMAAVAAGITQIGGTKNGPPFCGTKKTKKSAFDPIRLAAIAAVLAFVAILASLLPGLRAASIDPIQALRAE